MKEAAPAALHFLNERLSPDDVEGAPAICYLNGEIVIVRVTNGSP